MNNTKWEELRMGMYNLNSLSPRWRTCHTENEYISEWDGEWFYHFRIGGYQTIKWVEIKISSKEQDEAVLKILKQINVPGERTGNGFKIFGYLPENKSINYINQ
ncbi:DUF6678 family protein [Desulfosediminicola flagellatus]|uniref:DUF6678 family protein n=1 Tax=Desulfosediminicola flagellatus TaxID=2569541 RepID=UPI001C3C8ACA|nr:DUF6678 family protein [Desulfosediminicola flagellatus]